MSLADYRQLIDDKLKTLIPDSPHCPSLYEGARYTLLAPGKRIRPLLTLSVVSLLQGDLEAALIPACALEMVHTYSLIHDDLPCMDDDDFRRGLPTLHKVYTEGHAVLVGDYLLTYAFERLANAPHLTATQIVSLTSTLASAAGGQGMIGGQIMDIENSPHIDTLHSLKTAALFRASVLFGAIIAHATPSTFSTLSTFGTQFGKLFQLVDDILDNDHPLGPTQAHTSAQTLYDSILSLLDTLPGNPEALQNLTHILFSSRIPAMIET